MLPFRPPVLSDRDWVTDLVARSGRQDFDYNFTNLFLWKGACSTLLCRVDDLLVVHTGGAREGAFFCPAGQGDPFALLPALWEEARERAEPLRLCALTPAEVEQLKGRFPGRFDFRADRASGDYLYDIHRLCDLKGKKLHAKRNHINRFVEEHPDWTYQDLTPQAFPECLEMERRWYREGVAREGPEEIGDLQGEWEAIRLALEHFHALGLEGGLIRAEGRVVAFTIGDLLTPQIFDVHFEKAYSTLQGAYAIINREFSRRVRQRHPTVTLLDREEDMGLEGLRRAKESYFPEAVVEKFTALWVGKERP